MDVIMQPDVNDDNNVDDLCGLKVGMTKHNDVIQHLVRTVGSDVEFDITIRGLTLKSKTLTENCDVAYNVFITTTDAATLLEMLGYSGIDITLDLENRETNSVESETVLDNNRKQDNTCEKTLLENEDAVTFESENETQDDFKFSDSASTVEYDSDDNTGYYAENTVNKQQCQNDISAEETTNTNDALTPEDLSPNPNAVAKLEGLKCSKCNESFRTNAELLNHKEKAHNDNKNNLSLLHVCKTCGYSATIKSKLKIHEISHRSKRPYKCTKCDNDYKYKGQLNIHMINVHGVRKKKDVKKPCICDVCGYKALCPAQLKTHSIKHTTARPYSCNLCDKTYKRKSQIDFHKRTYHEVKLPTRKRENTSKCWICHMGLERGEVTKHMKLHAAVGERPTYLQCPYCEFTASIETMKQHVLIKHTGEKFICAHCGRKYGTASELTVHARSRHMGDGEYSWGKDLSDGETNETKDPEITHAVTNQDVTQNPDTVIKLEELTCSKCDECFSTNDELFDHEQKTHIENSVSGTYVCETCGHSAASKSKLEVHEISHRSKRPYKCTMCAKDYKYKENLTAHMRITHGQRLRRKRETRVFKSRICDVCGYEAASPAGLADHSLKHSTETPYTCDVCGKSYKRKEQFYVHKKKHSEQPPKPESKGEHTSKCGICHVELKRGEFKAHVKVHAAADGRPTSLQCPHCDFTAAIGCMKEHVLKHAGEKLICGYCGEKYETSVELTDHTRSNHIHDKQYPCAKCGETFLTQADLVLHRKSHKDQPFQCEICSRWLSSRANLKLHLRIHNAERASFFVRSAGSRLPKRGISKLTCWYIQVLDGSHVPSVLINVGIKASCSDMNERTLRKNRTNVLFARWRLAIREI